MVYLLHVAGGSSSTGNAISGALSKLSGLLPCKCSKYVWGDIVWIASKTFLHVVDVNHLDSNVHTFAQCSVMFE